MGRCPLHRSQGGLAPPDHVFGRHRRERADRRPDVRRLVDRGVEGNQRERHDPEAGSGRGLHRSLLGHADDDPDLRHRGARGRVALSRDPRSTAKRAETYLQSTGLGDTIYIGPEPEFFMFDSVEFDNTYASSYYKLDDVELPTNTGTTYESGNLGHRPRAKGGYFPVGPVDVTTDIRAEMVTTLMEMGLPMDKHHHEVAGGAASNWAHLRQARRDLRPHPDLQVRREHGGPGLWQDRDLHAQADQGRQRQRHAHPFVDLERREPLFAGNGYAGLSEMACISSAASSSTPRHQRLHQPTTNSYKRLVPGFEAPVLLAYSARNRSASCRIPYGVGHQGEALGRGRFPDRLAVLDLGVRPGGGDRRASRADRSREGMTPLMPPPRNCRRSRARCVRRSSSSHEDLLEAACSPRTRSTRTWN